MDKHVHDKMINDMRFSTDYTHFVTASTDRFAKLVDTETFEVLKVYNADRPCNSAAISPILDHVLIGGGQDAASVTTTAGRAGKFESAFFHKIYEEEFGSVRGHFGPINSVCFSPDGRQVMAGGLRWDRHLCHPCPARACVLTIESARLTARSS